MKNTMKSFYLLISFLISIAATAQDIQYSEEELKQKLDSVLLEADLLYKYEKSAWISTDLALADPNIKKEFGGYLTYNESEVIKTVILDKKYENSIAQYSFFNDFSRPMGVSSETKVLDAGEKQILAIKEKIIGQLNDPKYAIVVPQGYSLNLILIPTSEKYKLYIITGTTQSNVIPFGNDYLFIADSEGNIEDWRKFHSRLIPAQTKLPDGKQIISAIHSHLKSNPLISATDICTFRLYAPLYGLEEFSVYSPAIKKYMKYNLSANTITTDK